MIKFKYSNLIIYIIVYNVYYILGIILKMGKNDIFVEKTDLIEENLKSIKPKPSLKDFIPSIIYLSMLITQFILVFIYYNYYNLDFLAWIGWGTLIFFFVFGGLPRRDFKKYGRVEKGKNFIYTTVIVDKGIYSIIRHPQWLCWIILSLTVSFMSQYFITVILALPVCSLIYGETFLLDKRLIKKFGDDYSVYKKKVPRMNLIFGIIRYLKNNKKYTKLEML